MKYTLQYITNGIVTNSVDYTTLREILKLFDGVDYHQLRQIYHNSIGKNTKKLQKCNLALFEQIRIIDIVPNPMLKPVVIDV